MPNPIVRIEDVERTLATTNMAVVLREAMEVLKEVERNKRNKYKSDRETHDGTIRVSAELFAALVHYRLAAQEFFRTFAKDVDEVKKAFDEHTVPHKKTFDGVVGKGFHRVKSKTGRTFSKKPNPDATLWNIIWKENDPDVLWDTATSWNWGGSSFCIISRMMDDELLSTIKALSIHTKDGNFHPAMVVMIEEYKNRNLPLKTLPSTTFEFHRDQFHSNGFIHPFVRIERSK